LFGIGFYKRKKQTTLFLLTVVMEIFKFKNYIISLYFFEGGREGK